MTTAIKIGNYMCCGEIITRYR